MNIQKPEPGMVLGIVGMVITIVGSVVTSVANNKKNESTMDKLVEKYMKEHQ